MGDAGIHHRNLTGIDRRLRSEDGSEGAGGLLATRRAFVCATLQKLSLGARCPGRCDRSERQQNVCSHRAPPIDIVVPTSGKTFSLDVCRRWTVPLRRRTSAVVRNVSLRTATKSVVGLSGQAFHLRLHRALGATSSPS